MARRDPHQRALSQTCRFLLDHPAPPRSPDRAPPLDPGPGRERSLRHRQQTARRPAAVVPAPGGHLRTRTCGAWSSSTSPASAPPRRPPTRSPHGSRAGAGPGRAPRVKNATVRSSKGGTGRGARSWAKAMQTGRVHRMALAARAGGISEEGGRRLSMCPLPTAAISSPVPGGGGSLSCGPSPCEQATPIARDTAESRGWCRVCRAPWRHTPSPWRAEWTGRRPPPMLPEDRYLSLDIGIHRVVDLARGSTSQRQDHQTQTALELDEVTWRLLGYSPPLPL